jgi:hypothetical protein
MNPYTAMALLVIWVAICAVAVQGVAIWLVRGGRRFSLRASLIGIAAVALLLGMAIVLLRTLQAALE